jgi:exonuclease SbcC
MRFKSLTVAGAIPFPEPMTIDFPDKKKVALVGDNGAGKSTVFDCLYAAFFGDLTKPNGLYSLFKNSKDGMIDLSFEMSGQEYGIRRLIDGVGRKQKAYFYINGQPATEGKMAEFDALVSKTLGFSEKSFLASVYNAQTGKGNPLGLNDRERRDLLSEVLGLSQFDEPFERVSVELSAVLRNIDALHAQRLALGAKAQDPEVLQRQSILIVQEIRDLQKSIQTREEAIQKARQDLANAQANAQQLDEVNRQIKILQDQIEADRKVIADLDARVLKNKTELIDQAEAIRAAVKETADLEAQEKQNWETRGRLDKKITAFEEQWRQMMTEKQAQVADIKKKLSENQVEHQRGADQLRRAENAYEVALKNIQTLKPQTELLGEVPCIGTDMHGSCKLLQSARDVSEQIKTAEANLPQLVEELKQAQAEHDRLKAELLNIQTQVEVHEQQLADVMKMDPGADLKPELQKVQDALLASTKRIQELAPLVKNAPMLEDAEQRIAGYQQEIEVTRIRLTSNETALADWQKKADDARNLQVTINTCQLAIDTQELGRQEDTQKKDTLTGQVGQLDAQIKQAETIRQEIQGIDADLATHNSRVSLLEFLKEGLGPKGARALKIDSAGPEISELVNALLRECFGPKFTIVIKTLRDLQSGEQREKLEFSILDNETGEETPVENRSGGECQLIREVISLGLCIYQRRRAGIDIRTIIRDEACSALSEANTEKYIQMLDKAASIGNFDQVLFVSHKSVAQGMADAVIQIADGKAKVIQG